MDMLDKQAFVRVEMSDGGYKGEYVPVCVVLFFPILCALVGEFDTGRWMWDVQFEIGEYLYSFRILGIDRGPLGIWAVFLGGVAGAGRAALVRAAAVVWWKGTREVGG